MNSVFIFLILRLNLLTRCGGLRFSMNLSALLALMAPMEAPDLCGTPDGTLALLAPRTRRVQHRQVGSHQPRRDKPSRRQPRQWGPLHHLFLSPGRHRCGRGSGTLAVRREEMSRRERRGRRQVQKMRLVGLVHRNQSRVNNY